MFRPIFLIVSLMLVAFPTYARSQTQSAEENVISLSYQQSLTFTSQVHSLAWSYDNRYLAVSTDNGTTSVWDMRDWGRVYQVACGRFSKRDNLDWSPNALVLAIGCTGVQSNPEIDFSHPEVTVLLFETASQPVEFSSDGQRVAYVTPNGGVIIWNGEEQPTQEIRGRWYDENPTPFGDVQIPGESFPPEAYSTHIVQLRWSPQQDYFALSIMGHYAATEILEVETERSLYLPDVFSVAWHTDDEQAWITTHDIDPYTRLPYLVQIRLSDNHQVALDSADTPYALFDLVLETPQQDYPLSCGQPILLYDVRMNPYQVYLLMSSDSRPHPSCGVLDAVVLSPDLTQIAFTNTNQVDVWSIDLSPLLNSQSR